jgi:hypothetical protein
MELSQGNSLCSYLKQTKMLFFSFTNSENSKPEQVLSGGWGELVSFGGGKRWGNGVGR